MIKTKRAYEKPAEDDGYRVLVDRLWPRGLSKDEAEIDAWAKEIAPSDDLRKWFGHDPDKWGKFKQRYRAELQASEKRATMEKLARRARGETVTLLYAAKDEKHNNAGALQSFLENMQ